MTADHPTADRSLLLQELLGYLNFSSGTPDAQFLRNLNQLFGEIEAAPPSEEPTYRIAGRLLSARLEELAGSSPAFQDVEQVRAVLRLALEEFAPRYREFHRELLFHQDDAAIGRPFFMGRVFEAILQQGPPWEESDRIIDGAIAKLNDYVGHRPVAVLQNGRRTEPYAHEWLRPVPLYVRGAGVGVGRYHDVVGRALEILRKTDPVLLREAHFDPEMLDELALDPRAYDFDHPVNKRPNYHFGQWDPHHLDSQGRYRRFVAQQVTLDVLLDRVEQVGDRDHEELLLEAAVVLAGTILMASGTSGSSPEAHDSSVTLATLLPKIAAYRDAFYEAFIRQLGGAHGERLRAEAVAGRQPLAGARQHLNQQLARRRASQLEHVHLAIMFARMGYPRSALHQARIVPVAAARMACEIQCRITTGHRAVELGELDRAAELLSEAEEFLHRAIGCGALVDPWNILGFQGQFSLFPTPENSVPDHRIDQLVEVLQQIFGLYARVWSEAALAEKAALSEALARRMRSLARWWDQFAATTVEGIEAFSGAEAYDSAREVAEALAAFHQAGAAAGDIGFWRKRVAHFKSPKAYALVVDALWQKPDLVAAMALLMQWLSQAGLIPLKQGQYSFHALVERWLAEVCHLPGQEAQSGPSATTSELVGRFFDRLEANAEDFWQVPRLELMTGPTDAAARHKPADELLTDDDNEADHDDDEDEDDDRADDLYRAAYDDVVYIDSTGDGVDADMLEGGGHPVTDFELEHEARSASERLSFLRTVASLWKKAALAVGPQSAEGVGEEAVGRWLEQAVHNQEKLLNLLASVDARRIPAPTATRDSLLEFDRRRAIKEALSDKIVSTLIETSDASRAMRAVLRAVDGDKPRDVASPIDAVLRAVVHGEVEDVRRQWPEFLEWLAGHPLLYVPLGKGGDPQRLVAARTLEQSLRDLVQWLPRLGLLTETCQLLEAARLMETANPVGPGAISEYDRLFSAGYEAIVEALLASAQDWSDDPNDPEKVDNDLVECLEQATESLLKQWLAHSRTLRLSVLERIADEKAWRALVSFIERYGRDLFTQRFLHLGNLRAILHQGVDSWLARYEEQPDAGDLLLFQELGTKLPRTDAVKHLSLVIEAVAENYAEYRDYNSTTTQSDRGDLLYSLLDFLRLRVHYDRVAWHLKPVLAAHSILARSGRSGAAEMWRRALAERTSELADTLQTRCAELHKKYAMRLPTVTDRVAERFVRPLVIDRMRALVKPAMEEARGEMFSDQESAPSEAAPMAFALLEQETEELTQQPTGVGLDVPGWLAALEQEVDDVRRAHTHLDAQDPWRLPLDQRPLDVVEIQKQLTGWERNPH